MSKRTLYLAKERIERDVEDFLNYSSDKVIIAIGKTDEGKYVPYTLTGSLDSGNWSDIVDLGEGKWIGSFELNYEDFEEVNALEQIVTMSADSEDLAKHLGKMWNDFEESPTNYLKHLLGEA